MTTVKQITSELPPYHDLRQHLAALEAAGLLQRIDRTINKDTEMHPLVRLQYRGGIQEKNRKAFLFTNIVDATGRTFETPVLVGGLAGSRAIYALGMQCTVEQIGERWEKALHSPIPPISVSEPAPVHEVVHQGDELAAWGGLLNLPVPISTPGYDNAPYLSSAHFVTRDPETGIVNVGNYRGQLKSALTLAVQFSPHGADGAVHWEKARKRGEHLPVAIVIGAPPVVSYAAVTRVPLEVSEYGVAGGLAGAPVRLVDCKTVDLQVPADSEVVIEGRIRTDVLEPEGPFGESHGFVHLRTQSPVIEVTCITHRRDFIFTSFISQVTPSESSTIKIVSYEPMFFDFLRNDCGIKSLLGVVMHEPLSNIRPINFLRFRSGASQGEVWRALKLASSFKLGVGKLVIAVDEDIDPHNVDAVMWSLAYRMTPHVDVQIVRGYDKGHSPPFHDVPAIENSVMLINATLREKYPPISLPKRPFMEHAVDLWREIGLPEISLEAPWYGYSLGDWPDALDQEASLATEGRWLENGVSAAAHRVPSAGIALAHNE